GGNGPDTIWAGWGNDLSNADDDLRTGCTQTGNGGKCDVAGFSGLGDIPDGPNTSYNDVAYGGAGLDVLIGNTGGDRLIDWVGEFNSYLVPFSPFGLFTVVRLVQPQLPQFLYNLSKGDGADSTRALAGVTGTAAGSADRNGEPYGELGLVTQQDGNLWQNQTGAPRDPQPGNTSSQKRDILGKETFTTAAPQFAPTIGTWSVNATSATYNTTPGTSGGGAVSLYDLENRQPAY